MACLSASEHCFQQHVVLTSVHRDQPNGLSLACFAEVVLIAGLVSRSFNTLV